MKRLMLLVLMLLLAMMTLFSNAGSRHLQAETSDTHPRSQSRTTPSSVNLKAETEPKAEPRKVYVIVYDPLLRNGKRLSEHLKWQDHRVFTREAIRFFREVSKGYLDYKVVQTVTITDGWPAKIDGYRYTEDEYLSVLSGARSPHEPDMVDYGAIVSSPQLDICGKANRNEIDEVWIYNGPWFGFQAAALVGPGAYPYAGPSVTSRNTCRRLIPIMGPSPESSFENMIFIFGLRAEATMAKVYNSLGQQAAPNDWELFTLIEALSPGAQASGCGTVSQPPNAAEPFDYESRRSVSSYCQDFNNYLQRKTSPRSTVRPSATSLSCTRWGCSYLGFLRFWFSNFPNGPGCNVDGVANNWWIYFSFPLWATNPGSACG